MPSRKNPRLPVTVTTQADARAENQVRARTTKVKGITARINKYRGATLLRPCIFIFQKSVQIRLVRG
jgi:hypothetical protein